MVDGFGDDPVVVEGKGGEVVDGEPVGARGVVGSGDGDPLGQVSDEGDGDGVSAGVAARVAVGPIARRAAGARAR
jgi:hypothetical protein